MPHIILQHSFDFKDSEISALAKNIIFTMSKLEGNFDVSQCKFRNIAFENYIVGNYNESNSAFLHLVIKIMSGRTAEIKKNLSDKIFELLVSFAKVNKEKMTKDFYDISVDIVDMDRGCYNKVQLS